jgi:RHS repeat-associated protein
VTDTGVLWAWGLNVAGALGDSTTTTRRTPVPITGIPTIAAVSAGGAHSLAITTSATALAWGDNTAGQIGDSTTTRRLSPVAVLQPPSTITAIAAGGAHSIALASDAAFWTWGSNLLAQLGDGTHQPRPAPAPISGPNATWGVHPPLFSPAGGTFTTAVSVSLATPTPDAVIHYALDGADPTESHPAFVSPIGVTVTTTIKARAFRSGLTPSMVSAATYTIGGGTLATPVATPPAGTYAEAQSVTLAADSGAEIRYTLDASEPSPSSSLFGSPITIAATTTLRAKAFKAGFTPSEILTAQYIIQTNVPPGEDPPPDPATVAPPLSDAVLTDFADAYAFLFQGADPIQRHHTPGSIAAERMSVIRGRTLNRQGAPLVGVRVTPKGQPGIGHTVSRDDGMFDLAVNGGGPVTLEYTRDGFLPAERAVDAPWKDFAIAPDVRLVQLDPVVTQVSFEPQAISAVARGSVTTDAAGTRQATIVIPETGVMATIHLPDGTMMPGVSQLSIRATEYTVGVGGPEAMPAPLPATSGYTYAVELSADEALLAGATRVTFDPPLALYVENFLNVPVGIAVPVGFFEHAQSSWVASDNGRVISVLGTNTEGEAELDIDGFGEPAELEALENLNITSGERKRLALLYAPGQSLWRAPIPHFSKVDLNWPIGPPADSQDPNLDYDDGSGTGRTPDGQNANDCYGHGSIIGCYNQTLGELLPIAGTPLSLTYRSDRVPGYAGTRTLSIPLTNATVPATLRRVDLEVRVGGQQHKFTFPPTPGQATSFTWNGLDAYGRELNGRQPAQVTVSHVYDLVYYVGGDPNRPMFAVPPFTELGGIAFRNDVEVPRRQGMLFGVEARREELAPVAGWYVSAHHRYDPRAHVLFMGDGDQRAASALGDVINTIAGGGETPVETSPVPARQVQFANSVRAVAVAGDGSIYFTSDSKILRLAGGTVTPLVAIEPSEVGAEVDFNARPAARGDLVVYSYGDVQGSCGEGGSLGTLHVRRLGPGGPGEELAAIPASDFIPCSAGTHLVIATDSTIYLGGGRTLWAIRPGSEPQVHATFDIGIQRLAAGPDGSLYVGTNGQVYQWRPDGSRRLVAGNGSFGHMGDGGLAVDAALGFVDSMAADSKGNVFLATSDFNSTHIRVVRPSGIIEWYAGDDVPSLAQDGSAGRKVFFSSVLGMAFAQDGSLVLSNNFFHPLLMRLRVPFDGSRVPSSDGSSVYEFDLSGRHLRTVDSLTGVALLTFGYDASGRLTTITDRDGLETRIVRDGAGVPESIVSPFGVTTTLAIGSGGYLESVTDAEGQTVTLGYRDGGLLTSLRDANDGVHTFDYDPVGRLVLDADPAGGAQDLSRSESSNGWNVTRHVSDAGTTTYVTEQGANNTQTRRVTASDGTETISLNHGDGSTSITEPNGTQTSMTLAPDPRFGLAAPVPSSTAIRTPSGLTMAVGKSRTVVLSNPENPLSVVSQTETTTLNGRVSQRLFDAAARTITTISPANRRTVTTLDANGRPSSVQIGTSISPTTFTYDAAGRLQSQTQGTRTKTFAYDERGYLASVTDPLARTVQFTNDLTGRRLMQAFPDLREATFGSDGNGNLTSLTPPGQPAHIMTYTPVNLLESYTPPNVGAPGVTQFQFNLAKQPSTVTRADGQSITWVYDAAGRPATMTAPTGTTSYAYNPTTGQLDSLTSPSGVLAYSYDGGLLTSETASGFTAGTVSRNYDTSFRPATERINGANAIAFGYDADSLLTSAGTLTYARRGTDGLLLSATLGSAVTTFTYSNFGEPATEESRHGASLLYSGVYTRDNGGRLSERTETVGGSTTDLVYGYDLAGRLTTVTRNGSLHASYTYDPNGNRVSVTTGAGTITATYDAQDRIVTFGGRTYTHSGHGDVQSWTDSVGTTTLTYDVQGNLLAVNLPSGSTVEYVVDARNRRIGRKVNGAVTHRWLYQGQLRPVAELDSTGAILSRFVYGVRAVAPEYMIRGGVAYRLVTDYVGSVRLVVDTGTGAIAQRIDYDEWGRAIVDTNPGFQPFGFAGGSYDSFTGLVRFGARDYAPEIGRWLSKDPKGFDGGATNVYAYVASDPINAIDPRGEEIKVLGNQAQFWTAAQYLRKDPGMNKIIDQLIVSDDVLTVAAIDSGGNFYDANTHTIFWNPHCATETTQGGKQSPALALGHELAHAAARGWKQFFDNMLPDRDYDTWEEWRVITGPEAAAAKTLGEARRFDHKGKHYWVSSPILR